MLPDPDTIAWDEWLLLFVQIATLIALIIYVIKTWQIANETRRAAEASASATRESFEARMAALAPRVLLYFSTDDIQLAELVLENVGSGTAEDLDIEFNPPLQGTFKHIPHDFITTQHPVLPPHYRVKHAFGEWPKYMEQKLPERYEVRLKYKGLENGRNYEVRLTLDIRTLYRVSIERKGVHEIAQYMKALRGEVRTGLRELKQTLERQDRGGQVSELPARSLDHSLRSLFATSRMLSRALKSEQPVDTAALKNVLRTDVFTAVHAAERADAPTQLKDQLETVLQIAVEQPLLGSRSTDRLLEELTRLQVMVQGNE